MGVLRAVAKNIEAGALDSAESALRAANIEQRAVKMYETPGLLEDAIRVVYQPSDSSEALKLQVKRDHVEDSALLCVETLKGTDFWAGVGVASPRVVHEYKKRGMWEDAIRTSREIGGGDYEERVLVDEWVAQEMNTERAVAILQK